jgi:hypothetical protein
VSTPSSATGGMMRFAKKIKRCMGCKAALSPAAKDASLCEHCKGKEAEIYAASLNKVRRQEYESICRELGNTLLVFTVCSWCPSYKCLLSQCCLDMCK